MKNQKLVNILEEIGLSDKEARVYLAALSLGPTTALKISRTAGVKRPTVYPLVESLKQKGLMRIEPRGFKKLYAAEHPSKLKSILASRRSLLQEGMDELETLYNLGGGEGAVRYYEGLEAMKSVYEVLLEELRPHEAYWAISDHERFYNLDSKYFQQFMERRAKLRLDLRLLLQDTEAAREFRKYERNYAASVRLLPEDVVLNTNLLATPQQVVIHELVPPVKVIVIENKSTIESQQQLFELVWNSIDE